MGGGDRSGAGNGRNLVVNALLGGLVLGEEPEGPGQRHGGRFVTGDDECEQIGHHLCVGHGSVGVGIVRREQEVQQIGLR